MKKTLLLTAASLIAGVSLAQSPYTNSDEATIGASTTLYVVDSNATNYANINGNGATWDYSTLLGYGNETRAVGVSDATAHINASDFPTATNAMSIENFITTFYSVSATEKQQKGFLYTEETFGELKAIFEDNNTHQLNYPFNLNDNLEDDFSGTMNYVYIVPQSNPATGNISTTYDGNGTLMLEGMTMTDVVRLKVIDTTEFTSALGEVEFVREQYEYYDFATSALPVFVHATVNISGPVDITFNLVMSYVDPSDATASIDEAPKFEAVSVYPNPTVDNFNVKFNSNKGQKVSLELINAIGQKVMTKNVSATSGSNNVVIDAADLNKGIYFLAITAGEHKITKKILIK